MVARAAGALVPREMSRFDRGARSPEVDTPVGRVVGGGNRGALPVIVYAAQVDDHLAGQRTPRAEAAVT